MPRTGKTIPPALRPALSSGNVPPPHFLSTMKPQTAQDTLAADHKEQFDSQGYCVVDGLWTEQEIQEIEDLFEAYKHNGMNVFDVGFKFEEIDMTKRQVRALHPHRYSQKVLE